MCSSWTCSACTLLNQMSSDQCEVCTTPKRSTVSSSSSSSFPSLIPSMVASSSLYTNSQWSCTVCTFLNGEFDQVCDMCGTRRDVIENLGSALNNKSAVYVNDNDGDRNDNDDHHHVSNDVDIDDVMCDNGDGDGGGDEKQKKRMEKLQKNLNKSIRHNNPNSWEREGPLFNTQEDSSKMEGSLLVPQGTISNDAPQRGKLLDNDESTASIVSDPGSSANILLRQLHLDRVGRQKKVQVITRDNSSSADHPVNSRGSQFSAVQGDNHSISVLTYNVWFREDLEVTQRMNAIGGIICEHNPHFICFQEITPTIYNLFRSSTWWSRYQCSLTPALASKRAYFCILLSRVPNTSFSRSSYHNSVMGRELCISKVDLVGGKQLIVATTHLESPCPAPPTWNQMFSHERVDQAKEALDALKGHSNVVFGGDMNWDDKLDGSPPLPRGWCDAWSVLRSEEEGFTYDCKENPMLSGSRLRKRLDRLFCHLDDFQLQSIEMVGRNPIPSVTFQKEMKVKRQPQLVKLPVLPSDHFGLLLKLLPRL